MVFAPSVSVSGRSLQADGAADIRRALPEETPVEFVRDPIGTGPYKVTEWTPGQQIVLTPADEYITAFVKEVNRGRVIQAKTVMKPLAGTPEGMPIPHDMILETVAKSLTENGQTQAHVVDAAGQPIGRIDLPIVITAMVTPTSHLQQQAA